MSDRMLQSSSVAELAAEQLATSRSSVLDRSLASLVRVSWETVAWTLLFVVGGVARFYNLGVRAMSHDESLHALYSYYLYNQGDYQHNPMMHGPLLFHVNALVYFLFGDNDATARLAPALAGLGVMWMAYLFRRYIGRTGALAAGVMVTISPSLLFHSRYIRDDIYIALFTMIWAYGAFRYLDSRAPGGYHSRLRWLIVMMLGMAFSFVTMENSFIHGALFGLFFSALALWQVIGGRVFAAAAPALFGAGAGFWLLEADQTGVGLAVAGVGVAVSVALLGVWLIGPPWQKLRHNDAADLAILMATLVMPFLSPFGHLLFGWDAMAYTTNTDLMRSASLVFVLTVASVALAYYWFGMRSSGKGDEGVLTFNGWAQLMGIFWLIQVLFFTTFLTNTRNGLATGIVGSLGYWLAQHEVQRGGQPPYYYIMLGLLYEFLPLVLALGGGFAALRQMRREPKWDPVVAQDVPHELSLESGPKNVVAAGSAAAQTASARKGAEGHNAGAVEILRVNRQYFVVFSLWWSIGAWLSYSIAGEKMPWLLVHIALPMCILGGWWLGRLIRLTPWAEAREKGALWLVGLAPALLLLVAALLIGRPEGGREVDAIAGVTRWLATAAMVIGLGFLTWRLANRVGRATTLRLAALGGIALLFLFTVRFTYLLNYVNYDLVTEYLVYAHGSPDIKRALAEIDRISERTVGGRNIVVAYDDDSSWPLSWYMRQYPNAKFYGATPNSDAMSAPVIIVGPQNYDKVHPYVTRDYVKRTYRLVWWPDQGYFNLTWQRFIDTLRDPERMKRIFDIVFYRRYADDTDPNKERDLTKWPNRHDFEMWVHRDIAAQIWDLSVTPLASIGNAQEEMIRLRSIDLAATTMYGGQYGSLPLLAPRAAAVGPDG
ncbi:MAG TPA: flippase activity-associated protein Agl23, partial [Caldilineaceae bacterium]|nr:flippase activity-associated protein Agl23 [Caldilineaceae bacterium]